MYGLEQVHFQRLLIGIGLPYSTGMSYGLKRKMTPEDNTSISAIGALFKTRPEAVSLNVYHNRYARYAAQTGPVRCVRNRPVRAGRRGVRSYVEVARDRVGSRMTATSAKPAAPSRS